MRRCALSASMRRSVSAAPWLRGEAEGLLAGQLAAATANRVLVELARGRRRTTRARGRSAGPRARGCALRPRPFRGVLPRLLHPDRSFSVRRQRPPPRSATRAGPRSRSRTASWTASGTTMAALHVAATTPTSISGCASFVTGNPSSRHVGEPLDRRRLPRRHPIAPVREQIAAACVLASGWDGQGPVGDPLCGSGTLLTKRPGSRSASARPAAPELGLRAPARLRQPRVRVREERAILHPPGRPPLRQRLLRRSDRRGADQPGQAGVLDRAALTKAEPRTCTSGDSGLVSSSSAGERIGTAAEHWKALGDLLKHGSGDGRPWCSPARPRQADGLRPGGASRHERSAGDGFFCSTCTGLDRDVGEGFTHRR